MKGFQGCKRNEPVMIFFFFKGGVRFIGTPGQVEAVGKNDKNKLEKLFCVNKKESIIMIK